MGRETTRILHVTGSAGDGIAAAVVESSARPRSSSTIAVPARPPGGPRRCRPHLRTCSPAAATPGAARSGSPGRCARRCPPSPRASCTCMAPGPVGGRDRRPAGRPLRDRARDPLTPHCFSFERTDVPRPRRSACSRRRAGRGRLHRPCRLRQPPRGGPRGGARHPGRRRAQHDPGPRRPGPTAAASAAVDRHRRTGGAAAGTRLPAAGQGAARRRRSGRRQRLTWTWVGGGDPRPEAALRAAGSGSPAGAHPRKCAPTSPPPTYTCTPRPGRAARCRCSRRPRPGCPWSPAASRRWTPSASTRTLGTAEAVAAELTTVLTTGRPGRPRLQEAFAARHTPQAQAAALADAYAECPRPDPGAPAQPPRLNVCPGARLSALSNHWSRSGAPSVPSSRLTEVTRP